MGQKRTETNRNGQKRTETEKNRQKRTEADSKGQKRTEIPITNPKDGNKNCHYNSDS